MSWSQDNFLAINSSKTRELFIHLRKWEEVNTNLASSTTAIEMVSSFKVLSIHITSNLTWSLHIDAVIKKADQLYLGRL